MKAHIITLLVCLCSSMAMFAQGNGQPELDRVTIFSHGAQVYRHKQVALKTGEQTLSFTGISPYIDINSLQVKVQGRVTILGVSHRMVRPDSLMQTARMRSAEASLRQASHQAAEVEARRAVLQSQLEMVKTNSSTAARTVATPLEGIKQLNQYYYDETMAINRRIIALDDEQEKAKELVARRQETVDSLAGIKMKRIAVIDVKVDARQATSANFTFAYYVDGAAWYPSYDLRSASTASPLQLTYKANITQQTNEDWRNAAVTLSSANPNRSQVAPELKTYWLDYGLAAPTYEFGLDNNKVSGTVTDEEDNPVVGASIRVKGTTIGTSTDIDGHYTLTLPNGSRTLEASYIGMESQEKKATGSRLDFRLEDSKQRLEEVVVTGYSPDYAGEKAKFTAPVIKKDSEIKARRVDDDNSMDVASTAARFGYEFEIAHPLTILSDSKPVSCQIAQYELPTTYAYKGVPKIDRDAFLVADATGWGDLHLVEGEASVFFDNSYVGKTILNPDQQSDTLHLSMGRDNGIHIERRLVKSNTARRLLGSSEVETMNWEISVRNARSEQVEINIYDQIPVSRNSDISVSPIELSGGQLDKANGRVVWTLRLAPGEVQKLRLDYQVKHSRGRRLTVE